MAVRKLKLTRLFWQWDIVPEILLRNFWRERLPWSQKPFAVGVRVEHPQSMINASQYGSAADQLPAASYKLTYRTGKGRQVYTFCMCPGGYVVNASSEEGMCAVNGMSNRGRDGANANSAVIVGVSPEDFGSSDILAGMAFQRKWEKLAYEEGRDLCRCSFSMISKRKKSQSVLER